MGWDSHVWDGIRWDTPHSHARRDVMGRDRWDETVTYGMG